MAYNLYLCFETEIDIISGIPLTMSTQTTEINIYRCYRPVEGGGAGGARAPPPEFFRLELISATKVEFCY